MKKVRKTGKTLCKGSAETAAPVAASAPTPTEEAAVRRFWEKAKADLAPRLNFKNGGYDGTDHPDETTGNILLMASLGTVRPDFATGLLSQLGRITWRENEALANIETRFLISVVQGVGPRDEVEAMLAAQMAAVHQAAMTYASRLNSGLGVELSGEAERTMNRLMRTFNLQVEALKKYRSTGEQRVTVQHVQVNEGGQAIVGNINKGGG